jgi:hypothetical protein
MSLSMSSWRGKQDKRIIGMEMLHLPVIGMRGLG